MVAAAARMRRHRARRRAAGFRQERRWVPAVPATFSHHAVLDARSLALHCVIARKISRDPKLLDIARRNLASWTRAREPRQRPRCLQEWEAVLRWPWPRVAALITSMSDHATRLRQSSPFAGVLDPQERRRVYEAFRT
jgi:hypothetical protein